MRPEEWGERELAKRGVPAEAVRLMRVTRSPAGSHLDYQQFHRGLPVFGMGAGLHFDRDGTLLSAEVDIRTDIPPDGRLTMPTLSGQEAEAIAVAQVGGEEVLRGDPSEELGILALPEGGYTLAWRVVCPAYQPAGDWLFEVEAHTGAVLSRENIMVEARARVFYPNPLITSGNLQLFDLVTAGDNQELLLEQTETVQLLGLRPPSGKEVLAGELVRVVNANPPPDDALPGEELLFAPASPDFAAVMVYFWVDTLVRYLRRLGFADLFPQGVEADARDATARGGAFYSPWSRQMGFAPGTARYPAMAEDAKVILHELGHAIQHDQVRGWGSHPEGRAMGEGFGDALGTIYFAHVQRGFNREVLGDWARPPEGIRRVDLDRRFPRDLIGEPHHDGQIWSRALWDIYRALGGDSPDEEDRLKARDTAITLFVQSHYFLRPAARFADGARSLLQADQALFQGRHAPMIRRALAARGIEPGEAAATAAPPRRTPDRDAARHPAASQAQQPQSHQPALQQPAPAPPVPLPPGWNSALPQAALLAAWERARMSGMLLQALHQANLARATFPLNPLGLGWWPLR